MGKIIQNYELKEQLGEGVYAKVYKAIHLVTKEEVAIKVVQAEKFRQIPKLEECTVNEINILSTLQSCPYIVKYIDMLKTANNFYFVYEYCNGGTLDKLLQKEGALPEKKALIYFKQIVEAFKVLSKSNIMHRDIKPDNILMNNGMIKIADFGFCKPLENPHELAQTMLGSPIYMAPEVLKGEIYTMKADIWSLGVVLFQMVFGKCPFQSKSIAKLIKMLEDQEVNIPKYPQISQTLEKLLRKILVKDYTNRIDWKQIFEYTITETGQIYAPGVQPGSNQFGGLRSSIRSNNSFNNNGSLNFSTNGSLYTNNYSTSQANTPLSPKPKFQEDSSRFLMKKKSPYKEYGQKIDNSVSYNNNINSNNIKNETYAKNDRNNRLDLLLKTHSKCATLNQLILDMLKLEQPKCCYIAYYLFRGIQKQINSLQESLKKETTLDYGSNDPFKEFKSAVDQQQQNIKKGLYFIKDCLEETSDFKTTEIETRRQQIIKSYLDSLRIYKEEEIILALQILGYLEQSILMKKDSYEKLTKDHLQRQLKYKLSKYNIQKEIY